MKTYIIAEIGPNHNGNLNLAKEMINKLSKIGVDAVKFQISIPENSYSLDAFKVDYQKRNEKSKSPLEMSKTYQLSFDDHKILYNECQNCNVDYLCSAFEMESLKFIDKEFDLPFFKIPSGEIFTLDMLEYMAKKDKPIILSTGMSEYSEIGDALNILTKNKKKDITILHCISNYPAPYEDVNMNVMLEIKKRFGYNVGFSDHTIGNESAITAVALGALMIEKHVTSDKNLPGPDHKASSTIEEFADLVCSIRKVEKILGNSKKKFSSNEIEIKKAARKSIVSKRDIMKGEIIQESDICFKRPGIGFSPLEINLVVGKKVLSTIEENRVIKREFLKWE